MIATLIATAFRMMAVYIFGASGDVVIAPSADGYKMYVYYYDHNAQDVGAYVVDCIKR